MLSIENKFYTAVLRWKKGEMEALGSLDDASKERLLPHIVFPPLTVRDIEKRRMLSRDEFANLQVGRLQRFWTGRPCLADFRFLQFELDDKGSDAARISELLATSRTFGCKLIPVLHPQFDSYRMGALAAHIHNANSGGAIRIGLNDLQNDKLGELLATLLAGVRLKASDCILVVDLSDATISDHVIFAKFVSEWLSKLRHFGSWRRIIVEASGYPTKNPAAPKW